MNPREERTHCFRAGLWDGTGGFVCLSVAPEVSSLLPKGRTPVAITLNGHPFRTSLFSNGEGGHFMLVNKTMQKAIGATVGDEVAVELRIDRSLRTVTVPPELDAVLDDEARSTFEAMSYSHQKEYADWIAEGKREETRVRRAAQALERIRARRKP